MLLTSAISAFPSRASANPGPGSLLSADVHAAAIAQSGSEASRSVPGAVVRNIPGANRLAFVTPQEATGASQMLAFRHHSADEWPGLVPKVWKSSGAAALWRDNVASKWGQYVIDMQDLAFYRGFEIMTANTLFKVLWVIGTSGILVFSGGFLLYKVGGGERTLGQALFTSYALLSGAPGSSAVDEEKPASRLVVNIIALTGLFSFALILGIITSTMESALDAALAGNHKVVEREHIMLLNWNQATIPMLMQIEAAQAEGQVRRAPVAILANRDKAEMDLAIRSAMPDTKMNIETRQGDPTLIKDQKVSGGWANYVLVVSPEDSEDPNKELILQSASLRALQKDRRPNMELGSGGSKIHWVVANYDKTPEDHIVAGATVCPKNSFSKRLIAASAGQPGLVEVYNQMFTQGAGAELYLKPIKEIPWLADKPFKELAAHFPESVVMGWIEPKSDTRVVLGPGPDDIIPAKGSLVLLSADSNIKTTRHPVASAPTGWSSTHKCIGNAVEIKKQNILVIKSDQNTEALALIGNVLEKGSTVTVMSEEPLPLPWSPHVRFKGIKGCTLCFSDIASANIGSYDTVIIDGDSELDNDARDSEVLATARLVALARQEANQDGAKRGDLRLIISCESGRAVQLINRVANIEGVHVEAVPSSFIESGAILQVLWHPDLEVVFDDLMDPAGDEVVLVDGSFFAPKGAKRTFGQIADHALRNGAIAMGVITKDGGVILSPHRSRTFHMDEGVKVVSFTDALPDGTTKQRS